MKLERIDVLQQALEAVSLYPRCTAALGTGVGKCFLGLSHMEYNFKNNLKVLVVAPKLSIFQSWRDEAVKWNMEYLLKHITFSTYLSLNKQKLDYDIVYLDECHSLLYSMKDWLSAYQGKILGLTGSPAKYEHSEKGIMMAAYCPVVFSYGIDAAIDDDILNDYQIIVHTLDLGTKKDFLVKGKTKSWYSSERANYEYWTDQVHNAHTQRQKQITRVMRMKALMTYKTKELYARGLFSKITDRVILFCNTIEQAHSMCPWSYTSKNPDSEKNLELFQQGKVNKMSCVLQLSEGVNLKGLKQAIILHSYGNERKFSQRLGRILRLDPSENATVHVLVYRDTIDSTWVTAALEDFDKTKIIYKQEPIKI